jgi:hypothetical protein
MVRAQNVACLSVRQALPEIGYVSKRKPSFDVDQLNALL